MIDISNDRKYNPDCYFDDDDDYKQINSKNIEYENENYDTTLIEDKLHLLWPYISAFSFVTKCWGEIFIENIKEIIFDDNAYDKLVIDQDKKLLVKSLVNNFKNCFTDIISNKSGGCIFLLHGPPGTGKTLTAESIAEFLHVPLYSVTSGELGTHCGDVEYKLTEILYLSESWNAVMLIDEADVFLEKRSTSEIQRNSIVSIFLRCLERYNGIMFLTTNRITDIDDAFQSRISVSFEYNQLTENEKFFIFSNLLNHSKINLSIEDIQKYSKLKINGRQIKNLIKLAHVVSIEENVPTNSTHFEKVLKICHDDYYY